MKVIVQTEPTCTNAPKDAYVKQLNCQMPSAMSKLYQFKPGGLTVERKIMFVIPLFAAHNYDYKNMTLMYKRNPHSEFVPANTLAEHTPTWLFHGNRCYVFLSHFCKAYVKKTSNEESESHQLETLLFCKQNGNVLELKTTFGCYKEISNCSVKKNVEVMFWKN